MKSIELFAGIGGIALAAKWAGIETIAFCEKDPFCQKVLKKHWPNVPIFDDVCKLNRQILEEGGVIEPGGTVDIISGGFPCQPYSIAGKRRGKEDDRDLWPEMFRILQELKPTWVVGENVANFANMELERTLVDLESEGYETQTFIIPACAVDAKHRRDRTFVVAYSYSSWELQQERRIKKFGERISNSSEIIPNPYSKRLERGANAGEVGREGEKRNQQFAGCNPTGATWATEPNVGRVAHGIPNRVDRLKALGNAVVPQQIYPIFKAIMRITS
ncbi:DNA (cytosine-5-)-methyltransferase [Anoxybacillus sp. UARK-01]|uniref:DNA cytosine methyltransferase n=1 Tax=Anoxybacillus sp. UARK-01 TaxID=1895648 RepID=UPI0009BA3CAC|nr:DNA (cytosine-5-)-methyltransferase [Anoxybacillus sp. UARK-01]OQM47515.1 DNA (cytosine-5-)-methyltransferase [Anoxybacillus sp. UARK-01]